VLLVRTRVEILDATLIDKLRLHVLLAPHPTVRIAAGKTLRLITPVAANRSPGHVRAWQ
jgi:hypothetical protein